MWKLLLPALLAMQGQRSKQRHERKMARLQSGQTDYTPFILGGLLLFGANKIFGKSQENKEGEQATEKLEHEKLQNNPFAPANYTRPAAKKGFSRLTLNGKQLASITKQIWDGFGYITDDESAITAGIKMAGTKDDLYYIVKFYNKKYNHDLWTDIDKNLNKKEKGKISKFVVKLPEYVKG